MDDYRELKRMLKLELDKITKKGDMNPNDLENATKIVCLLGKLEELDDIEMSKESGYSERGYSRSMPIRYTIPSNSHRYDYGYSGDPIKYHTLNRLKMMWEESQDSHEKQIISEAIEKLER